MGHGSCINSVGYPHSFILACLPDKETNMCFFFFFGEFQIEFIFISFAHIHWSPISYSILAGELRASCVLGCKLGCLSVKKKCIGYVLCAKGLT